MTPKCERDNEEMFLIEMPKNDSELIEMFEKNFCYNKTFVLKKSTFAKIIREACILFKCSKCGFKKMINIEDLTIEEIQTILFKEYSLNGYLKEWTNNFSNNYDKTQMKFDIAELGLITTEVSEAIEEIRKNTTRTDELFFECADIIIRTLNFMSRCGANDASFFIIEKNKKNLTRGKLHGKQV